MPEGIDLVTWNPRVGASGDDRYAWPPEARLFAGPSVFSNPPTLQEVNAASGLNQLVGETARRRYLQATGFFQGDVQTSRTLLGLLMSGIGSTRNLEGRPTFPFTKTSWNKDEAFRAQHLLEMRKALATDYIAVYPNLAEYRYEPALQSTFRNLTASRAAFPATAWGFDIIDGVSDAFGQSFAGGMFNRIRRYDFFQIPPAIPPIGQVRLKVRYFRGLFTGLEARIYRTAQYVGPLSANDAPGNLDILEAAFPNAGLPPQYSDQEFAVSVIGMTPGAKVSYIYATDREINQVQPIGYEVDLIIWSASPGPTALKLYTV